jgi:hypothetical protein
MAEASAVEVVTHAEGAIVPPSEVAEFVAELTSQAVERILADPNVAAAC